MKKLLYLLLIPVVLLCLVGCDQKPPKEKDLKIWLARTINDDYKIKFQENTSNINKDDYTITFECESQYGFEFEASVHYAYVENKTDACGDLSGYKRIYETDYEDKLMEYLDDEIKTVENKYNISRRGTNYYVIEIDKYKDINKLNSFAYDYYNIFKSKDINTTRMNIKMCFKFDNGKEPEKIEFESLMKDKKEHLKELQYYYISKVQSGEIKDSTIPKMSSVIVEDWYINDTPIEDIVKKPSEIILLPETDEYATIFSKSSFGDLLYFKDIVEGAFNGEYEKDENKVTYKINDEKHKIDFEDSNYFKFDSKKMYYKSTPIYYPVGHNNSQKSAISIDDFAEIIDCTYEIKKDAIYFYSK